MFLLAFLAACDERVEKLQPPASVIKENVNAVRMHLKCVFVYSLRYYIGIEVFSKMLINMLMFTIFTILVLCVNISPFANYNKKINTAKSDGKVICLFGLKLVVKMLTSPDNIKVGQIHCLGTMHICT